MVLVMFSGLYAALGGLPASVEGTRIILAYGHLFASRPRLAAAALLTRSSDAAKGATSPAGLFSARGERLGKPVAVPVLAVVARGPNAAELAISPVLRLGSTRSECFGGPVSGFVLAVSAGSSEAAQLAVGPVTLRLLPARGHRLSRPVAVTVFAVSASCSDAAKLAVSPVAGRLRTARGHRLSGPVRGFIFAVAAGSSEATKVAVVPVLWLVSARGHGFFGPVSSEARLALFARSHHPTQLAVRPLGLGTAGVDDVLFGDAVVALPDGGPSRTLATRVTRKLVVETADRAILWPVRGADVARFSTTAPANVNTGRLLATNVNTAVEHAAETIVNGDVGGIDGSLSVEVHFEIRLSKSNN